MLPDRFFVVNPYSIKGGLTIALEFSKAIGTSFNAGSWMRPCSVEIPTDAVEADIARELLKETGVAFHESPWDLARG